MTSATVDASGGGPRLIEALTYRLSDHTTADDARRYRSELEVERARALDPVPRLRAFLEREGVWSDADEQALLVEQARLVDEAVEKYLNAPPPKPGAMFEHLFETLPPALEAQRDAVEGEEGEPS